jgi:predicted lipoprotein with Yx(FWY)xxD motif
MKSRIFAAIAATAVICASSLALAQMASARTADTEKGKTLVDSKGMTLYHSTRTPVECRRAMAPACTTGRR